MEPSCKIEIRLTAKFSAERRLAVKVDSSGAAKRRVPGEPEWRGRQRYHEGARCAFECNVGFRFVVCPLTVLPSCTLHRAPPHITQGVASQANQARQRPRNGVAVGAFFVRRTCAHNPPRTIVRFAPAAISPTDRVISCPPHNIIMISPWATA